MRQKQRHRAMMMAQTLTVPLEPSFVPFGFFCMTAVADLESLMSAGDRNRPGRGVWYRRTEVWMQCPGKERIWDGVWFIYPTSMAPEKQVRL